MHKKVFFISQHNFGIGDFTQIKRISNALSLNSNIEVWHFSGGISLENNEESNVILKQLPIIGRIKPDSGELQAIGGEDIVAVHKDRAKLLLEHFKKGRPSMIITGFFPFSKHRLEGTLLPLLKYIKENYPETKILSSVRDIPVSDHGPFLKDCYSDVNEIFKEFYDGILHHTDPNLIHSSSIPFMDRTIHGINVYETGFVSSANTEKEQEYNIEYDYLITVGGGWDGRKTIEDSCINILNEESSAKIIIICGPRMVIDDINFIKDRFRNTTVLERVDDLEFYIRKSKIVISMAGYSTVPEIIKCKKPCVLIPRYDSFEQINRARAFEKAGFLICHETDQENSLYKSIVKLKSISIKFNINIDGAKNTVDIIKKLLFN